VLAGAVLLTGGLGWWVVLVTWMEPTARAEASGYGQFVLAAIGLAIMAAGPVVRKFAQHRGLSVDEQVRLLSEAVREQWTREATKRRLRVPAPVPLFWRRSTRQVAGPVSAAIRPRFDPLPGLTAVGAARLRRGSIEVLHAIYGGLGSGRLLVIGAPASGKSASAVLLLLDALKFRDDAATVEDRARIPVPVLLTPHGWDPDHVPVTEWVAGQLAQNYKVFQGWGGRRRAADLVAAGRVAMFFDSLDEILESRRSAAVAALATVSCRLVVFSRSDEAATPAPLAGAAALELLPVKPADAAGYLLQSLVAPPPEPWRVLIDDLVADPGGSLTKALANPLNLSLLRDTYDPADPVDELLDTTRFPTPTAIEDHLLDRAVIAAYTPRPSHPRPRYTLETAQHTLRQVAIRLERAGTRDLAWWHIPAWTSRLTRIIAIGLAYGIFAGFAIGLTTSTGSRLTTGLNYGALATLITIVMANISVRSPNAPKRRRLPNPRALLDPKALIAGAAMGVLFGLIVVPFASPATGLAFGLATLVAVPLMIDLDTSTPTDINTDDPQQTWRNDRNACLVIGLTAATACGLAIGATAGWLPGVLFGLALLIVAILMDNGAIRTTFAAVQLTITAGTPIRLMAFLHDAHECHLLRAVGPLYQFRHAKLQTRLAKLPT
jgi:hypothetical protein